MPSKVKEKISHVTDEVSRAMEKVNVEMARASSEHQRQRRRKEKTAEERRERHLTKGAIKFFTGGGLAIFLYFLTSSLVLKLPADVVAKIPFAIDPVVHIFWLIGLIPMLSGIGHIIAGLSIKTRPGKEIESAHAAPLRIDVPALQNTRSDPELTIISPRDTPASVTERTTNILDRDQQLRTREIG